MSSKQQILMNRFEQIFKIILFVSCIVLVNVTGKYGMCYMGNVVSIAILLYLVFGIYIPKTVFKLLRIRFAKQQLQNARIVFKTAMGASLVLHILVSIVFILLSATIMHFVMPETEFPLGLTFVIPAMLFFTLIGIIRAYFQCFNRVLTVIVSRGVCLVTFLVTLLILTGPLMNYGLKVDALLKTNCFAGQYGSIAISIAFLVSGIVTFLYLSWMYLVYRPFMAKQLAIDVSRFRETRKSALLLLVQNSLPEFVHSFSNDIFMIGLYFVYIFSRRILLAAKQSSTDYWGVFVIIFCVLIMLPFFLERIFAVETSISLKRLLKDEDYTAARKTLWNKTHKLFSISIAYTVFIIVFAQKILFFTTGVSKGTLLTCVLILSAGSLVVPLLTCYHTVILALGHGGKIVAANFIAAAASIVLSIALFKFDSLGIINSAICVSVYLLLLMAMDFVILQRLLRFSGNYLKLVCFPILCAGITGIILLLINKAISTIDHQLLNGLYLLLMYFVNTLIHIILLLMLHGIEESELDTGFSNRLIHKLGELLHIF